MILSFRLFSADNRSLPNLIRVRSQSPSHTSWGGLDRRPFNL